MAFGVVVLLPMRVAVLGTLLVLYFVLVWLLFTLFGAASRRLLRIITKLFLGAGFFFGGVRLHVTGKWEVLFYPFVLFCFVLLPSPCVCYQGTTTIVSNHCSYLDILVHLYLLSPRFVAKVLEFIIMINLTYCFSDLCTLCTLSLLSRKELKIFLVWDFWHKFSTVCMLLTLGHQAEG